MLFDSHAHYDDEKFDPDRKQVIEKAFESGVGYILNAASDLDSSKMCLELARQFEGIYAAVGIHPHNVEKAGENAIEEIEAMARQPKVVAIGEAGLDYYYDFSPRTLQQEWFAAQIRLSKKLGLPIIVHSRDSHEDTLKIIKKEKAGDTGGVFHCFTGSLEMAKILLDNNFYISLGGAVTFKNARKAVEAAEYIPLDRLLIETDCPYMTPHPFRGERNDSSYIRLVAEKIALIKDVTFEEIARRTTENAIRLFGIQ